MKQFLDLLVLTLGKEVFTATTGNSESNVTERENRKWL